jgi:hypothetical protein
LTQPTARLLAPPVSPFAPRAGSPFAPRKFFFSFTGLPVLAFLFSAAFSNPASALAPVAAQEPAPVRLRVITTAGESFLADFEDSPIVFSAMRENGQSTETTLQLSDLASLKLVTVPEDSSVAKVAELVAQLGNSEWVKREAAETELKKLLQRPEVKEQLQTATSHPSLEIRYRASRLLSGASGGTVLAARRWEYDTAILRDGRILNGNAGAILGRGTRDGEPIDLGRTGLLALYSPSQIPANNPAWEAGSRLFHKFRQLPADFQIDFETGVGGRTLVQGAVLDREFLGSGLLLDARFSGEPSASGVLLVSAYTFNFENKPVGRNSVCVSRNVNALQTRFKGITELRFCEPWEASAPAGVNRIGMFAARNDGPLAFVMQAFNEDGHLLAEVEANEERCPWFEVESGEPVARVCFRANPFALQLNQTIDEDYALDNVAYSQPAPVETGEQGLVRLRNGDLLTVTEIVPGDGAIAIRDPAARAVRTVPQDQIAWWAAPQVQLPSDAESDRNWFVLLPDRSVVAVSWADNGLVRVRDGQPVDSGSFAALWSGRGPLRFPVEGDHDFGEQVAVFPGARLACGEFRLSRQGIEWTGEAVTALYQPVMISRIGNVPPDPTGGNLAADPRPVPEFDSVGWKETEPWKLPSIWFEAPQLPNRKTGSFSLRNGEKFAFGEGASFSLQSSGGAGIELADQNGKAFEISWDEVWRMAAPAEH